MNKYFFVFLCKEILDKAMDRTVDISNLRRSDVGKRHKKSKYGGMRIGMYGLNGVLEREFSGIDDAVEHNDVGATYVGIVNCVGGRMKTHCRKIWRKEEI